MWHIPPPNSSPSFAVSAIFCPVTFSSAEFMRSVSLELYILLSMVGAVFDGFRAFQTAFKAQAALMQPDGCKLCLDLLIYCR